MEDQKLLDLPNATPPSVPGTGSLARTGTRLPTRANSKATSRPLKLWNAIWDDWYTMTGKVN